MANFTPPSCRITAAIVAAILLVPWCCEACGDFAVDFKCIERETGTPCEEIQRQDEPGWPCGGDGGGDDNQPLGCVKAAEFIYTGHPCRDFEPTQVRMCRFSVFHEDCEEFDELGNDWVTDCLEYQPNMVDLTVTGPNSEVFYMGRVQRGQAFVIENEGECLPSEIMMEAIEVAGSYEITGVDFRHNIQLVSGNKAMPVGVDYGSFRLEATTCSTDRRLDTIASSDISATQSEACFTAVDLRFCVYTDSPVPIHLRFDDVEYNTADVLSEDFLRGEVVIEKSFPFCRDVNSVQLDKCRRQHEWAYEFGIHNLECTTTTVLTKASFNLRF